MTNFKSFAPLWLAFVLSCFIVPGSSAYAHPGHTGEFQAGLQHPLTGIDHLLAMVCVGLLAARCGGRALWLMPASFLGCMVFGGVLAATGVSLPGIEIGIIASVLVLGTLVAMAQTTPQRLASGLVMLFAIFHGHAHGVEMLAGGSVATYTAGYILSTTLLLTGGVVAGLGAQRLQKEEVLRAAGAAIAVAGMMIFISG